LRVYCIFKHTLKSAGTLCRELCKKAELIKMQFGMLSQVCPGNTRVHITK